MKEYLKVWSLYTIPWEQLVITSVQIIFHNLAVENPHVFIKGDFEMDIDETVQKRLSKIKENFERLKNYIDNSDDTESKNKLLKEMDDTTLIEIIKDQYKFAKNTKSLSKHEQIAESIKNYYHDFLRLRKQLAEQLADLKQTGE